MEYGEYAALYPDGPGAELFPRLEWEARRALERAVTGVDGVMKLDAAPPEEERAAEAVRRCHGALIHRLWELERESNYVNRDDGTAMPGLVTAVTAGAESVTFAAPRTSTAESRERALRETAEAYLAGIADGNGVPLLYAGPYPAGRAGKE